MDNRYAIIENGVVTNVVLADPTFAEEQGWVAAPDDVGPGWLWDGTNFSPPPPAPPVVPEAITMRQTRLALLNAGLLSQVDAAIASLPPDERASAEIDWQYATIVERTSPLVLQISGALGLTSQQVDDLFIAGAAL